MATRAEADLTNHSDITTNVIQICIFSLVVLSYLMFRLIFLTEGNPSQNSFGHDSAYIAIVANNLLAGRGFINDAHWLVFLHPDQLPMPYHNANPLYVEAIAALSSISGYPSLYSGYAISAISSVVLLALLLALARLYYQSTIKCLALACAGTFFPTVFSSSHDLLPDMLWLALITASLSCTVRRNHIWWAIGSGLFFGLAWLTRSSAILVLPALAMYLLLSHGWKRLFQWTAIFSLFALLVSIPWLWHQAETWGTPFRSDSSYYLLQEYHARNHGDPEIGIEKYWHSIDEPLSLSSLMREEPIELALFWMSGVPATIKTIIATWSMGHLSIAGILAILLLNSLFRGYFCVRKDYANAKRYAPEIAASIMYAITTILVFAVRDHSLEIRYFILLSMVFGMLLMAGSIKAWDEMSKGQLKLVNGMLLLIAGFFWLIYVPMTNLWSAKVLSENNLDHASYFQTADLVRQKNQTNHPVVVGTYPYYYTFETKQSALSIPVCTDDYLKDYMQKYDARLIFLTDSELRLWRPDWLESSQIPGWLTMNRIGDAYLFERKDQP